MSNPYYTETGFPGHREFGASAAMRGQLLLLRQGFDGVHEAMVAMQETLDQVQARYTQVVSPTDAPWLAAGNGTTDDLAALQACFNWAAGRAKVHIPEGDFGISGVLRLPSYTEASGCGEMTRIFALAGVGGNVPLVQTGGDGDRRVHIHLSDIWLDYNVARWTNANASLPSGVLTSRTLGIVNSEWVRIDRCRVTGGKSHNIDITNPGSVPPVGAEVYGANPSRYVFINGCRFDAWGDDAITTHHSSQVWIRDCVMRDPAGTTGTTGGIEIDDGSRNVFVLGCEVIGAESAYACKGHGSPAPGPGPYNVQFLQNRAINCCQGLMLRQSGSSGTAPSLEDFEDESTGFSRTAIHIVVDGLEIIAPRKTQDGYTQPVGAMDIQAYSTVFMDKIVITEGLEDLTNKDWLAAGEITADSLVKVYSGARRIHMGKVAINGFRDVDYGIRATGTAGGTDGRLQIHLDHLVVRDGPRFPFYFAAGDAKDIYLMNYDISGAHEEDGGIGIYAAVDQSADSAHVYIGPGRVAGYEWTAEVSGRKYTANMMHMPTEVRSWGRMAVMGEGTDPVMGSRFAAQPVGGIAGFITRPNSDSERDCYALENFAGNWIGGLRSAGTRAALYLTPTVFISGGTGSPEGAVSAGVGSEWLRSDGGAGSSRYRKASGTGNTGWTAYA